MGRSAAFTGGGRAEATAAHDGDSPAGRFAARGVAKAASTGVAPPAGVPTGKDAAAASAALCFSTLASRRCARDGGAAEELETGVSLGTQPVIECSFVAGAARGEPLPEALLERLRSDFGIISWTTNTSRRPGIAPVIATTWRKPRRTNGSVATMRKSAACRCAAISPRSARLVARRIGIVRRRPLEIELLLLLAIAL